MNFFNDEMLAALQNPQVRLLYAVRLEWPDSVVRLHTEIGTFNHFPFDAGESYFGVGNLGSIGDVTYGDGDETTPSVTLELSVKDDALRAQIMAGGYQGRKGQLYLVALDEQGRVAAWAEQFNGVMDSATIKQGEKNNTIQLPLTAPDDALEKGLNWRCTNESHHAQYPGDDFYRFTTWMEDLGLYWGSKKDGIPLRKYL
ncbi:hypothetical protein [Vibrio quintilis]|uniref:DUF2163 domain-containing protein n=1 Tax=Vibrio quintilis TaxID=1117707 RepID=A0A1M7Z1P9_9VIBR|nr:hypothetical protein [Vibrio quintilis]SHO58803.1 hypothetical protein VQ7734_04575 [Vibrio quintilis]